MFPKMCYVCIVPSQSPITTPPSASSKTTCQLGRQEFLGGEQPKHRFFQGGSKPLKSCFAKKKTTEYKFEVAAKMTSGGKNIQRPIIVGVSGDSGCGKSTFVRRLTDIVGGQFDFDRHTAVGDMMTVICLDDYHLYDRQGRKERGITPLIPEANDLDLMYEQILKLKNLEPIEKPIYNHKTGEIEGPETVHPNHIVIVEGLHPMYSAKLRSLLDFSIYIDVADEIKFAWKIQRDVQERGHTVEGVQKEIQQRLPDFKAYVEPQREHAAVIMQLLPTGLIPNDKTYSVLRARLIQREGWLGFSPVYLIDEGSTIHWVPCGRKLTCSFPGIQFFYGPDTWYDHNVSVLEMDGNFERLEELMYVEQFLHSTSAKYLGELTSHVLTHSALPGSKNGSGVMQVLMGMKIRRLYEKLNRTTAGWNEAARLVAPRAPHRDVGAENLESTRIVREAVEEPQLVTEFST